MKHLTQYVASKNALARMFGGAQLDINDAIDRIEIADLLDSDISPENLSCDGELSQREIKRRYAYYVACANELKQCDPTVRFTDVDFM